MINSKEKRPLLEEDKIKKYEKKYGYEKVHGIVAINPDGSSSRDLGTAMIISSIFRAAAGSEEDIEPEDIIIKGVTIND